MRKTYVISDLHIGHAKMITKTNDNGDLIRPGFDTVDQMDEFILTRWNEIVKTGDKVYVPGDVMLGCKLRFQKIWPKFHGSKRLIAGNHDDLKHMVRGGFFKEVYSSRKLSDLGILITHIPVHEMSLHGDKKPLLNVHGHIHHLPSPPGPYLNVSVERLNYRPMDMDEIVAVRDMYYNAAPARGCLQKSGSP